MLAAIATRIAGALLLAAVVQLGLWFVARRTTNAGIVDVGWALSFALVVGLFAGSARAPATSWFPIAALVFAWSLRLGGHLLARGAATGPEEGRYADLRQRWGPNAPARFFVFFQVQAALTGVLSLAFVVPFLAQPTRPALCVLGALVALTGLIGETIADVQLARWKRVPANHTAVCDVGLWGYSRHPNYFFEWLYWVGLAVYGLAFPMPWGLLGLVGQAIIFASIWGVTGIPPTEANAIRSRGEAYRDYQRRVSKFVPMPPKRLSRHDQV